MIQRVQTIFLLLTACLIIFFTIYVPVMQKSNKVIYMNDLFWSNFFLIIASLMSIISILMFKNRKYQLIICSFARVQITISLLLLLFYYKNGFYLKIDTLLFSIPYLTLLISSYFIKKDDKLVNSSNRIR